MRREDELMIRRGEDDMDRGGGEIALRIVGVAALALLGLLVWSELPAIRRYIKMERM